MKKLILLTLFFTTISVGFSQGLYKATSGKISFFSETPMENIDAINKKVKAIINTKSNEFAFICTIMGFKFEKPMMEEHFNETYMESDKFKTAMFKGKIIGDVDYTKDGKYTVEAKGTLKIHGVEKERTIKAEINIADGKVMVVGEFEIDLKDHKIKIPKLVIKNIAETVRVTVNMEFESKQ